MTHKIIRSDGVTELSPIKSFTIQQSVNTGVDLRPGCVSSARIEVEVFGSASDAPASGEALTVYEVDEELNETQIGIFYATPSVSSKTTYSFTAYDGLKNTSVDFSQRLREVQDSFPITLLDLVTEALTVSGLTLSGTFPLSTLPVQQFLQDGLTCRDILSYAAEIAGRFVRCDEDGNVIFDWYTDSRGITPTTVSGSVVTIQDGVEDRGVDSLIVEFEATQSGSGTPSPNNIRPINGRTNVPAYVSPTSDIADAVEYTAVFEEEKYNGEVDIVSGLLKETYGYSLITGDDVREYLSDGQGARVIVGLHGGEAKHIGAHGMANEYEFVTAGYNNWTIKPNFYTAIIFDSRFTSLQVARELLDANPVQVVYELETPRTSYASVPLIVRMFGGTNYFWSTLGDVTVTYSPDSGKRIYPTSGTSPDGTETYYPYKQDGIEYGNETDQIISCAVHPTDNSAEPVVYPASGTTQIEADSIIVSDSTINDMADMEITIPYTGTEQFGAQIHVTGKNLLETTLRSTEVSGLNITRNMDGSFTVNGTYTGTISIQIATMQVPRGITQMIFSGNIEGATPFGEVANWYTEIQFSPGLGQWVPLRGTGDVVVDVPETATIATIRLYVKTNSTISNAAYKPMLRLNASDSSEFEAYGETYTIGWLQDASDVYGGTYDPILGELVSMYDAFGNVLSTPVTYTLTAQTIKAVAGQMVIWASGLTASNSNQFYPISVSYPSSGNFSGNVIHVQNNILLGEASYETLKSVAQNIYIRMLPIAQYRPARINLFPFENPFRAGDIVNVTDAQGVSFVTPVMSMSITPEAAVIESTGTEEYEDTSSVEKQIQNLTDNMVRINRLKVGWADIDEAVIRSLRTNFLQILGLLISGDYTTASALVTQIVDGIIQFLRGDDTQMFGAIGLNQVDSTDNALHVSSTDDGDSVAIDYFTGTEYKPAYEADFTDPDNPVNEFTGTMTLNGVAIPTQTDLNTKMSKWDLLWENSSITSAFAAQTLSPSFAGYDFFLLIYGLSNTSPNNRMSMFLKVGEQASMSFTSWYGSSTMAVTDRSFYFTNNQIHFNDATRHVSGQSSSGTYNNGAIPQKIYGIKNS